MFMKLKKYYLNTKNSQEPESLALQHYATYKQLPEAAIFLRKIVAKFNPLWDNKKKAKTFYANNLFMESLNSVI